MGARNAQRVVERRCRGCGQFVRSLTGERSMCLACTQLVIDHRVGTGEFEPYRLREFVDGPERR